MNSKKEKNNCLYCMKENSLLFGKKAKVTFAQIPEGEKLIREDERRKCIKIIETLPKIFGTYAEKKAYERVIRAIKAEGN